MEEFGAVWLSESLLLILYYIMSDIQVIIILYPMTELVFERKLANFVLKFLVGTRAGIFLRIVKVPFRCRLGAV